MLRAAVQQTGLPSEVFALPEALPATALRLANLARISDIVVLSVWGTVQYPRLSLVEAVLFGTGRPILLVPPQTARFLHNRVVIAWDGSSSCVRALHDAMPLLVKAQEVLVLTVADDKGMEPEVSGELLCRALIRRGLRVQPGIINKGAGDVGAVLLKAALQDSADLLVMGGFAHSREREFLFGSATRSVLQSGFPMPILMSH